MIQQHTHKSLNRFHHLPPETCQSSTQTTHTTTNKKFTTCSTTIPSFLPPFVAQEVRTNIGKITNSPVIKKIERLLQLLQSKYSQSDSCTTIHQNTENTCRTQFDKERLILRNQKHRTVLEGGGNHPQNKNIQRSCQTDQSFISHFRYQNFDDKRNIHQWKTLTITAQDILRLRQGKFLNDTLIDYGIRHSIHNGNTSILSLSTQFYTILRDSGPTHAIHWHTANIFRRQLILFPIHESSHWSLCVIYMPPNNTHTKQIISPQILHLDSTTIHKTSCVIKNIRSWIQAEWNNQSTSSLPPRYNVHQLPLKYLHMSQQVNGFDCGVYVCRYAKISVEYYYKRHTLNRSQQYHVTADYITQLQKTMLQNINNHKVRQLPSITHQKSPIQKQSTSSSKPISALKPTSTISDCDILIMNKAVVKGRDHLGSNKTKLNPTWQKIFSKALRP